jgi:hypothetical protein
VKAVIAQDIFIVGVKFVHSWPNMSCRKVFMVQISMELWVTVRVPDIQYRKVTSRTLTV